MATKLVTICDCCGEQQPVEKRRVGDITRLFTVELCAKCREAVDDLIAQATARKPRQARLQASTPADIKKARAAAKKTAPRKGP